MSTTTTGDDDGARLDEPDDERAVEPAVDAPAGSWWQRLDKSLLVVSLLVAVGLMFVVRGVLVGVTGDDRADLPEAIERIDPVPEAVRVLSQTSVFVDLASGYTGRFVIDGVEIETVAIGDIANDDLEPGQQVSVPPVTIYEPGNATLTFTPVPGGPIEEFAEGLHEATVIYWRIEDGPARPRSYSWTFNTV